MTVRLAEPDDIEPLIALCGEHARFERTTYECEGKRARLLAALFSNSPRLNAWVGIVNRQPIGYATATEDFSTWRAASFLHVDCLFVRPGHRNAGIGAALLSAVMQHARDHDIQEVQWQTPVWNTDACRFYQRFGASALERVRFRLPVE